MSDETTEYISLPVNSVKYVSDKLLRLSVENTALRERADRTERILAALREASSDIVFAANTHICRAEQVWDHNVKAGLRAAVIAAEQEVGNE